MALFDKCPHVWKVIDKTILESPCELFAKMTKGTDAKLKSEPEDFFKQTYICIMVCEKCGEVNKTVV